MQAFPNSYDFRKKAREILKPSATVALMLAFLAALPGLISETARTMYITPVVNNLQVLMAQMSVQLSQVVGLTAMNQTVTDFENRVLELAENAMFASGVQLAGILSVVVWLVTPFLRMGLLASLMKLHQGEEVGYSSVLCRANCFFKAILQLLWISFKEFLWILPGIAMCVAGFYLAIKMKSLEVFSTMYFGGILVAIVLVLRAALHYSMAQMVMADRPTMGVIASVRESVRIMRHRKRYYIALYISFIGWLLLTNLCVNFLSGISSVLGILASLILNLVVGLYIDTAFAGFYLHYKTQPDEF